MVYHNTEARNEINFAIMLVEVEMGAQLPDEPTLYIFCNKYGHMEEDYRVKKKIPKTGQMNRKNAAEQGAYIVKQKQAT
ncbi:hypothetical protein H5410_010970 [Solanum commersonii]|uniref:Uncharacterized protein n=1 Tax=Solanum commersonii TaxID=4109 RepID=A0A9J6AM81_SOLCO|nr:hypothetical protein H5410_010970 [Solanum commersonii]